MRINDDIFGWSICRSTTAAFPGLPSPSLVQIPNLPTFSWRLKISVHASWSHVQMKDQIVMSWCYILVSMVKYPSVATSQTPNSSSSLCSWVSMPSFHFQHWPMVYVKNVRRYFVCWMHIRVWEQIRVCSWVSSVFYELKESVHLIGTRCM